MHVLLVSNNSRGGSRISARRGRGIDKSFFEKAFWAISIYQKKFSCTFFIVYWEKQCGKNTPILLRKTNKERYELN